MSDTTRPSGGAHAPHSPPETLIPCRAGLRIIPKTLGPQTCVYVVSPKTGKQICLSDGWFAEIREKAPRLISRVAHANATGNHTVMLAVSDLKVLAELLHRLEAPKPRVAPVPGGLFRRFTPSGRVRGRRWGA